MDEVDDIPLELQLKVLRVLREQEFERLGSTRTQRVDARVLAATNGSLTQMVHRKEVSQCSLLALECVPDCHPISGRAP